MDDQRDDTEHARTSSLLVSIKRMLATLVELVGTRLELASTELEEERVRLQEIAAYSIAAIFFLSIGVVMATIFVMVVFWDTHRLEAAGACTAFYFVLGIGSALVVRSKSRNKPKAFSTTLSELRRDKDSLLR
jgi:uncharacterized membrane protein YqjE